MTSWQALRRTFALAMESFGSFEPRPLVAVAFSGGSDSLALLLLANDWARSRRGRVVAATVDHGLRPGSRREAYWAARRARAICGDHQILRWTADKPTGGLQAAARRARYALLDDWAAGKGALHLLTGHTRDDQMETLTMRRRRSGFGHGLAGMSALVERRSLRLLRPLLDVRRKDLQAALAERGQAWIVDPSNRNRRFERVRVRAKGARGLPRSAMESPRFARDREKQEEDLAHWLARWVHLDPDGTARVSLQAFADGRESSLHRQAMGRILTTVGGRDYGPARASLSRLLGQISACSGPKHENMSRGLACLSGVEIRRAEGSLWFFREWRRLPSASRLEPGQMMIWDRRFRVALSIDYPWTVRVIPSCAKADGRGPLPSWTGNPKEGQPAKSPEFSARTVAVRGPSLTFSPPNSLSPTGFFGTRRRPFVE